MILPEILFQHVLEEGIRGVKKDKQQMAQLFRNAPGKYIDQFHEALNANPIAITFEFPTKNIESPLIWINMVSDDENSAFLGEIMGMGHGADGVTLLDGNTYPHVRMPAGMFYDSENESQGRVDVLGGESLYVGEARASSTSVDPAAVASPVSEDIIGEPQRVFDVSTEGRHNRVPVYEKYGQEYAANYAITIIAEDSTFLIFMYNLVRLFINRNRLLLDRNGVKNLSMSGTDFMGDTDLLPPNVFSRSVQLGFTYFFEDMQEVTDHGKGVDMRVDIMSEGEVVDSIQILGSTITLTAITPNTGAQGATVTVIVSGTNIHYGAVVEIEGDDLVLGAAQYIAGNRLQFGVLIDASAALTSRDVTVTNPDGLSDTLEGGFTITT